MAVCRGVSPPAARETRRLLPDLSADRLRTPTEAFDEDPPVTTTSNAGSSDLLCQRRTALLSRPATPDVSELVNQRSVRSYTGSPLAPPGCPQPHQGWVGAFRREIFEVRSHLSNTTGPEMLFLEPEGAGATVIFQSRSQGLAGPSVSYCTVKTWVAVIVLSRRSVTVIDAAPGVVRTDANVWKPPSSAVKV